MTEREALLGSSASDVSALPVKDLFPSDVLLSLWSTFERRLPEFAEILRVVVTVGFQWDKTSKVLNCVTLLRVAGPHLNKEKNRRKFSWT